MKITWCSLKIEENYHVVLNKFHGNFRSKTLSFRKIKYVFRDVKWCFNASWGLKGLNVKHPITRNRARRRWFDQIHYLIIAKKLRRSAIIFKTVTFSSRVELVFAHVGLATSSFFCVTRRVASRHVPNRARVRVGVFCSLRRRAMLLKGLPPPSPHERYTKIKWKFKAPEKTELVCRPILSCKHNSLQYTTLYATNSHVSNSGVKAFKIAWCRDMGGFVCSTDCLRNAWPTASTCGPMLWEHSTVLQQWLGIQIVWLGFRWIHRNIDKKYF